MIQWGNGASRQADRQMKRRTKSGFEKNSIKYYNNFFNIFIPPWLTDCLFPTLFMALVCFELYLRICYGSAGLQFQH